MALEVERKYLHVNFDALRSRLKLCGARGGEAHFESNLVFDSNDLGLMGKGCLLRLRTQEWPGRCKSILTFKKPMTGVNHFKTREERELVIADAATMTVILTDLGYSVQARYEKIREVWSLGDVEIVLDTLPFMQVVEIEGVPEKILEVEKSLGLDKTETNTSSYHELHVAWRRANNLPEERSFVFDDRARQLWRGRLGL